MRTFCIASGKGGSSKTTLTADLAAWLAKGSAEKRAKIAIVDLNSDQADLTRWWGRRGRPASPYLQEVSADFSLRRALPALAKVGFSVCLIDTHPTDTDIIAAGIVEADATIIPIKPDEKDLEDAKTVVRLCRKFRKPFAFVLTQVDRRPANRKNLSAQRAVVEKEGPLLTAMLGYSNAYGMTLVDESLRGKSGPELDKAVDADIAAVWSEVQKLGVREGEEGLEDLPGIPTKRGRK